MSVFVGAVGASVGTSVDMFLGTLVGHLLVRLPVFQYSMVFVYLLIIPLDVEINLNKTMIYADQYRYLL